MKHTCSEGYQHTVVKFKCDDVCELSLQVFLRQYVLNRGPFSASLQFCRQKLWTVQSTSEAGAWLCIICPFYSMWDVAKVLNRVYRTLYI